MSDLTVATMIVSTLVYLVVTLWIPRKSKEETY